MSNAETVQTPADLRALVARIRVPIYQLAAEVTLHPSRLGAMLNERIPMPPEIAIRIAEVLHELVIERRSRLAP